jgi:predicted YcjX-like family ATPase
MKKPPLRGDIFVPHDIALDVDGLNFFYTEDWWLDISILGRSAYGGWSWKIERIGKSDYRDGALTWHWMEAEDNPVIAAAIAHIEQTATDLDQEVQYKAREREAEAA